MLFPLQMTPMQGRRRVRRDMRNLFDTCSSLLQLILIGFNLAAASQAQMVPGLYIFGDSLADVGNNNFLRLSLLKANFPHNGIDYPGGQPTGRFSNGKNAIDFIADKLGLPSPPPYLSLSAVLNNGSLVRTAVNFASGGAGILDGSPGSFGESISLDKQIQYFSVVYEHIVRNLGSEEAHKHLSISLFGIVIGSNDLLGYFKRNSPLPSKTAPQLYVDLLLSTLSGQMQKIYDLGARRLFFIGAGAVGCCPSQRLQNRTEGCNDETNYWSHQYNEGARKMLESMKSKYHDMEYCFFNAYHALLQLIQRPAVYGFAEVKSACCGLGELRAESPCLPIASYCSNRKTHVFWDLYHPTEAVLNLITDMLLDGPEEYVMPINLRVLYRKSEW